MKSPAIIFRNIDEVVIEEVCLPELKPSEILVEIEYSFLSTGTERWCLKGKLQTSEGVFTKFPFICGYQAAGKIIEIGNDVVGCNIGDKVFSSGSMKPNGWEGSWWGGHMKFHITKPDYVIRLPDNISLIEASSILIAQVGYNGAMKPEISDGDSVIIFGDGLVGQYASQVLKYRGAEVLMVGHHDFRLAKAKKISGCQVINSKNNTSDALNYNSFQNSFNIAVETTGKRNSVKIASDKLIKEGQLVLLGYYPKDECLIDTHWFREKELKLYFPNANTKKRNMETLELLKNGCINTKDLITHEFLYEKASEAYELINNNTEDFLGIVFRWI